MHAPWSLFYVAVAALAVSASATSSSPPKPSSTSPSFRTSYGGPSSTYAPVPGTTVCPPPTTTKPQTLTTSISSVTFLQSGTTTLSVYSIHWVNDSTTVSVDDYETVTYSSAITSTYYLTTLVSFTSVAAHNTAHSPTVCGFTPVKSEPAYVAKTITKTLSSTYYSPATITKTIGTTTLTSAVISNTSTITTTVTPYSYISRSRTSTTVTYTRSAAVDYDACKTDNIAGLTPDGYSIDRIGLSDSKYTLIRTGSQDPFDCCADCQGRQFCSGSFYDRSGNGGGCQLVVPKNSTTPLICDPRAIHANGSSVIKLSDNVPNRLIVSNGPCGQILVYDGQFIPGTGTS